MKITAITDDGNDGVLEEVVAVFTPQEVALLVNFIGGLTDEAIAKTLYLSVKGAVEGYDFPHTDAVLNELFKRLAGLLDDSGGIDVYA